MKTLLAAIAAVAVASVPAAASAKSPLEGRWKNGKMEIVISPCGRTLCGTVVKASPVQQAKAERGSGTDLVGATLIQGIERTGPGTYRGRVFVADRNVHANGTITRFPAQLKVRGCVAGSRLQIEDLGPGPLGQKLLAGPNFARQHRRLERGHVVGPIAVGGEVGRQLAHL
jgi:uncharacterized protein (DUF2147 family)